MINNRQIFEILNSRRVPDNRLSDNAIDARVAQADKISHYNPYQSETGKGLGISFYDGTKPIVVKDDAEFKEVASILMDSDVYQSNIPSSGVPSYFTTMFTTRVIEFLYKAMTLHKLTGSWQQGVPGTTDIKIPVEQQAAIAPVVYSDLSAEGGASINYNWVPRQIAYFQQMIQWGDMQQAQFGLGKIDYANRLRNSMTNLVAQQQNDIGFQGYNGIPSGESPQIFGVINEPNLNPAISLPNDGTIPGTLTKTTAFQGKDFNQIVRDIQLLVSEVIKNAEGHVELGTKFILAIPPSALAPLTSPNPIASKSVIAYLRETWNIEIVQCPNFEAEMVPGINQTMIMVLFEHPNGEKPYDELFVTKWQGHRPVPMYSSIGEKISYGIGGVILKYPFLVSHAYGV